MSQVLEIAATAARLVVEECMDYGSAKRRAAQQLGLKRPELPSNEMVEEQVRDYLALFCADTQPAELAALRKVALLYMHRLDGFRPYLTGAVWRGTATRLNVVHLQLFCDDCKAPEIALINQGIDYDVGSTSGPRGQELNALSFAHSCVELGEPVTVVLSILDYDDLRGAGGSSDRGDAAALQSMMQKGQP